VQVTLARYGWTNKTFMVLSRVWDREKGVIRLTLKETTAAIFSPDAAFDPEGYAENTALRN
jgi:precorrin-6B methylase 1